MAHRLVVLNRDRGWARDSIIHELYHLLGFHHPGESTEVHMSREMMDDWPSVSVASDLSRLACIYDEADQQEPFPTDSVTTTAESTDWDEWREEFEQGMADACKELKEAFEDDVPGCD